MLLTVAAALAPASMPAAAASAPSHGPVGWDTYRHPERLTDISGDGRTLQSSSFDRGGGNGDGNSWCLRTTSAGCVIAERSGAGEIDSIWFTRDEGNVTATGAITVELDGKTVLSGSLQDIVNGKKGAPFVYPLVANADQSSGGVYVKVPMPFTSSMRVTVEHGPVYYHVTYRTFADARGISTFDPSDKAEDVIARLKAAGTADPKPAQAGARTRTTTVSLPKGASKTVAAGSGSGAITAISVKIPQLAAPGANTTDITVSDEIIRNTRLQISFDGRRTVDAPLGEFFGSGLGLYPVRALMFGMDPATKTMTAWWQMPYRSNATITLRNNSSLVDIGSAQLSVTTAAARFDSSAGYFHAYSDRTIEKNGQDHTFVDTTGRGRIVGVTQTMEGLIPPNGRGYLEGDERLFVDGSVTPQMYGTGTEDFYESGWYFNRGVDTDPMNGNPAHEIQGLGCVYDCTGAYRLMLAEGPQYGSSVRFGIEHGGYDGDPAVYGSTTYYYAQDNRTLKWTDAVTVGDQNSEKAHGYTGGAAATAVAGTYEGYDVPQPTVTRKVRAATSPVSFKLAISRDNRGVELRRTSDQKDGYQSAAVSVNGVAAGTWLQPLGNPGARWLDDSYDLPAALTAGKSSITVTLTPTAGAPAWTAASYAAVSVLPSTVDTRSPAAVPAATATGTDVNAIDLSWQPATDDTYAPRYQVFASTEPDFAANEDTLLTTTPLLSFSHTDLGTKQTWYYRVRAVDAAGHTGPLSAQVSAVSGAKLRVEAENMPVVSSTAPIGPQGDCCGIHWSNGNQMWFTPHSAPNNAVLEFNVSTTGTYDLSMVLTKAVDYGIVTFALDGQTIGDPYDAFNANAVLITAPLPYGQHQLAAGTHRLTMTVTGKNASATGFFAGIDYLDLKLAT
ncbi:glycoside hydrolase family 172 protein [Fodinicola acaciae]|uniref:glycoside hydrolase family 172 protein n=1 Tax=Fodinicola acaciae TaxID=2681555 RepID=UPI001C9E4A39|nr:glycoside hydrolase family 172 protein [Fodinicola acaciae]